MLERVPNVSVHTGPDSTLSGVRDRLESFERDRRDIEPIIFGLPNMQGEVMLDTISIIVAHLSTSVSPSDVVNVFRIHSRVPSSHPLIIRFTAVTRRNQLLTLARRRGRFVTSYPLRLMAH